jgi:hypothetical protein
LQGIRWNISSVKIYAQCFNFCYDSAIQVYFPGCACDGIRGHLTRSYSIAFRRRTTERLLMNHCAFSTFALLALAPLALAAQAQTAAPVLLAEAASPASFSTSAAPEALVVATTGAATSSTADSSTKSGGSVPFSGLAVGVKFGVAGIGFDVATPLIRQSLNLRGGASFLSYTPSTITTDNLNINGNIKFQNSAIMVDYFPFHGRFRISGGMTIYNNTGLTATLSVPTGQSFTVGGVDYYSDPRNPLSGSGVFNFGGKTAPRVTIGSGNMLPKKGRFTFQSELGVEFFSQPTVLYHFTGNGCPAANSPESNCAPIPTSNVLNEQNKLQNDLSDLRFFPVLSFGLSYRIH